MKRKLTDDGDDSGAKKLKMEPVDPLLSLTPKIIEGLPGATVHLKPRVIIDPASAGSGDAERKVRGIETVREAAQESIKRMREFAEVLISGPLPNDIATQIFKVREAEHNATCDKIGLK